MKPKQPFSIAAMILAKTTGTWGRIDSNERRAVSEMHERYGLPDSGFDALPMNALAQRSTLIAGSTASGGYLDDTVVQGYLPSLQPQSTLLKLGAQVVSLDKTTTAVPLAASTLAPVWLSDEVTPNAVTSLSLGLVTFSRKNLLVPVTISRQLLLQSNAEAVVRAELARQCAVELDKQGIQGDGNAGRPLGILNQPGTITFSGTSLAYSTLVSMMQAIPDNNAVVNEDALGFLTTPAIAGELKQRLITSALPIWAGAIPRGAIDEQDAYGTKNVPAGALIHADFSNLLIGQWADGMQIDVDPFTQFQSALITMRLCVSIDIQVRTPLAFAIATGVT